MNNEMTFDCSKIDVTSIIDYYIMPDQALASDSASTMCTKQREFDMSA